MRDQYGIYISPADVEQAEKNGIRRETLRSRLNCGWTAQNAVNKPLRRCMSDATYKHYKDIAAQNGIYSSLFIGRLKIGWTFEEAAYVPKHRNRKSFMIDKMLKGDYTNDNGR